LNLQKREFGPRIAYGIRSIETNRSSNSRTRKENMRPNRNRFHTLFLCPLILGVLGWHHESTAGSLHLTWSDNSQNGNGFEIERSLGDTGVFSLIAILAPHETWYSDHNLAYNTTYCYRVRAYNSAGDSPYSDEFCATTVASGHTVNTISTNISNG
jgi:hypothetical protein